MLKVDTQVLESLEDAGQVNEQSLQCDDLPLIQLRPIWGPTRWGQVEGSGWARISQPGEEQHWWSEHKDDIVSCVMKMRSAGQIWKQPLVGKKNPRELNYDGN
jgi:hypothetical protein